MKANELFGVGVRLVGLITIVLGLPSALTLSYTAAAPIVAGLILITRAELLVRLCYPRNPREALMAD